MKELLPNMFGLYLGCKVRLTNKKGDILTFKAVGKNYMEFEEFENTRFQFGGKLLLKPLSSISEEDKREFEEEFTIGNKIKKFSTNEEGDIVFCSEFEDWYGEPMDVWENISYEQLVWLTSNGYHIEKLLPREYVEIQEV